MKRLAIGALCACPLTSAMAQTTTNDTIKTQELNEVVVEARNQRLGSYVSIFIPTSKQKNAAQTAADLLNRMAIPQLRISPDDEITDPAGKSVDLFIDFIPAAKDDLEGMRMHDVKKVEYYDFPSDPRFQGKAHVVNFVMQKYEYGGYVKGYGLENSSNAGQVSLYGKLKYKRMTFDIAAGAFYTNQNHTGCDTYETFRLPQPDGAVNVFERNSYMIKGKCGHAHTGLHSRLCTLPTRLRFKISLARISIIRRSTASRGTWCIHLRCCRVRISRHFLPTGSTRFLTAVIGILL